MTHRVWRLLNTGIWLRIGLAKLCVPHLRTHPRYALRIMQPCRPEVLADPQAA